MFYLLWKWIGDDGWFRLLRLFKYQTFRAMCRQRPRSHRLFAMAVVHQDDACVPACASRLDTTANSTTAAMSAVPTMGGIVLLSAIIISALLWSDPANIFVLMTIGAGWREPRSALRRVAKLHPSAGRTIRARTALRLARRTARGG